MTMPCFKWALSLSHPELYVYLLACHQFSDQLIHTYAEAAPAFTFIAKYPGHNLDLTYYFFMANPLHSPLAFESRSWHPHSFASILGSRNFVRCYECNHLDCSIVILTRAICNYIICAQITYSGQPKGFFYTSSSYCSDCSASLAR